MSNGFRLGGEGMLESKSGEGDVHPGRCILTEKHAAVELWRCKNGLKKRSRKKRWGGEPFLFLVRHDRGLI